LIKIDKAPWYRWALQRMGLQYEYEIFGDAMEGCSTFLKQDRKDSGNAFFKCLKGKH